jgi:toxin ParE1/3/4
LAVEWLPLARADLLTIVDYIAKENPVAAQAVYDTIQRHVARLGELPRVGRPGRRRGTRELVVPGTPHIVGYRIEGTAVAVLRVLHGARRWPERM